MAVTQNFLGNDRADEVDFGHLVQFPLFAQPMVVIYYVPGFSYSRPTLVLTTFPSDFLEHFLMATS